MIDWTKPVRLKGTDRLVHYIGKDIDGAVIAQYPRQNGTFHEPACWSAQEIACLFENVPVERPKLEGFCPVELETDGTVFLQKAHVGMRSVALHRADNPDIIGVIDLSRIPADLIEWIDG